LFIWDIAVDNIYNQLLELLYQNVLESLNGLFAMMNMMGAEIFDLKWTKALILFFQYLGWAFFVIGFVVAVFEVALAYTKGNGNLQDIGINTIKGFMAVMLFTKLPIELYKFAITLQTSLAGSMIGMSTSISDLSISSLGVAATVSSSLGMMLLLLIAMGFAVLKVFFQNIKRGGILLIQICVGSFYMFSIPRGFIDGFIGWVKQIIGLCLTAFLQTIMLSLGLLIVSDNFLLGLGVMMASSEVPRITERFGLDTSIKGNMMSSVYAVSSVSNIARTVARSAK
jgi:hypothetical protein